MEGIFNDILKFKERDPGDTAVHAKVVTIRGISNSSIQCIPQYRSTPKIRHIDPQFLPLIPNRFIKSKIRHPRFQKRKTTLIIQCKNFIHPPPQINENTSSNTRYYQGTRISQFQGKGNYELLLRIQDFGR